MTFEHQGRKFRIGFRHDLSRRWEDHMGHSITLVRAQKKGVNYTAVTGPPFLWCLSCNLQLSHLKREQKRRNTHCTIWIDSGVIDEVQTWAVIANGQGKLNSAAGDTFDREKGRVAALKDALEQAMEAAKDETAVSPLLGSTLLTAREFREALWKWFLHGRKRSAVEKARGKTA